MKTQFEIILYVADQEKSKVFYSQLFGSPSLDVPGMTEFEVGDNVKLGLMPEEGIAKIIADKAPHPKIGNGIPRCELYIKTENALNLYNIALSAGATLISAFSDRDWGDKVGYVMDADGHIIAFAH
ncbi:VOC family protein [Pontibacter sp. H259]|uniref:VOC family protein n=1 Tax=Pontibacter sp. H259 TaxID=3133421 RepID=UPI0030C45FC0